MLVQTRRALRVLVSVALLIPLSGCLVVSLLPVYDKSNVEFNDALQGTWENTEEHASLTIARGAWNAYDLTYREGNDTTHVTAYLTRIGGRMVLDVTTASGVEAPPVTIEAHWAFLVDLQGDTLRLQPLDYDWFKSRVTDRALSPLAAVRDGSQNVVITAGTDAIRTWLAAHFATEGVWDEGAAFTRRPAGDRASSPLVPAPRETEAIIEQHDSDDYTRYELLAPASGQFRIAYDVTATETGAKYYFNVIRKGSEATDEAVYDRRSGEKLPFTVVSSADAKKAGLAAAEADTHYIQVTLPRPVPARGEVRLRIDKTYKDKQSYFGDGNLIVFSRSLGIRRNAVVLPPGYELVACNFPSQVAVESDGRIRVSFMNTGAGAVPLVVKARQLPASVRLPSTVLGTRKPDATKDGESVRPEPAAAKIPAVSAAAGPSMASRLAERARQDREIVYFLQQPDTHAFALYHDYTESRPGVGKYFNVVRAGSRASNPAARLLDTGESLKVETVKGAEILAANLDVGDPVEPDTDVIVITFPPVQKGQTARLRISETYTDEDRYYLNGDELVWDRSLGRSRNAVVLPGGWYLTASSIPATVTMMPDGRVRMDYDNGRPDEVAVLIKGRRR